MSANQVEVRPLRASDRAAWDELWGGYLSFYEHVLESQVTEWLWARLIAPAEQPHALVAVTDDGAVVGFVHYHFHLSTWSIGGYCYLEDLYVSPAARGKGAGRALIEAVYRAADEKGATRVYWHTQNTNTQARALYDKVATLSPFVQYRRR